VPAAASGLLVIVLVFWGPSLDSSLAYGLARDSARSFDEVMQVQEALKSGVPADRHVRFWYDTNEPVSRIFNAVYSLYLWAYYDFTRELPAATLDTVRNFISPETVLVHLTMDPSKMAIRNGILAARGIHVGNERRWQFQAGPYRYYLILDDVTDMSGLH
jgi:hypothetical protein